MANIQILEISHSEYEIEDLSHDMTNKILGGAGFFLPGLLDCVGDLIDEVGEDGNVGVGAVAEFFICLAAEFRF